MLWLAKLKVPVEVMVKGVLSELEVGALESHSR